MELIATAKSRSLIMSLLKEEKVHKLLQRLREHHKPTYHHSIRVGIMSAALGGPYSLDDDSLRLLGYGGLLHDIGKIDIPGWILDKPGTLGEKELQLLHEHPRNGHNILAKFSPPEVRNLVVAHHEYKLSSYPRSGDRRALQRDSSDRRAVDVSLLSQLIALSDIYDALSSERAYKPALPFFQVKEIMEKQYTGDHIHLETLVGLYKQHVFKYHSA